MGLHWSIFKGRRVPSCLDNCKTKEMRKLFIEHLAHIRKTEKYTSFQDWTFISYLKELPKKQRSELIKNRKPLTGQEWLDFDKDISKKYSRILDEKARMQRYEEQLKKTMPVVCSECGTYLGSRGWLCVERLSTGHILEMVFCNEDHHEKWFRRFKDSLEEDKELERLKLQRKRESEEHNIFEAGLSNIRKSTIVWLMGEHA